MLGGRHNQLDHRCTVDKVVRTGGKNGEALACSEIGLVGYDIRLTRGGPWVRFPDLVYLNFEPQEKKQGPTGI